MGYLNDYYAKTKKPNPFNSGQSSPSALPKQQAGKTASSSRGYLTQYAQQHKLKSLFDAVPVTKAPTTQPVTKPVTQTAPKQSGVRDFLHNTVAPLAKKGVEVIKNLPEAHFADKMNFYTPVGFAAHLAQGAVNTPAEAMKASVHLGETTRDKKATVKSAAGDVAAMLQFPLLFFGGGTAKSAIETAGKGTLKAFATAAGKSIATGAGFGLLGGIQTGRDIQDANEYAKNLLTNVGLGAATAGALHGATEVAVPLAKGLSHQAGAIFIKVAGKTPKVEGFHLDPKAAQSMVIANDLGKTPAGKAIMREAIVAEQAGEHVAVMVEKNGKYTLPNGEKVTITTEPVYTPSQVSKNALEPGKQSVTVGKLTYQKSDLLTTPEHRVIEKKFGEYLGNNYEKAKAEYQKKFGNVLNTDNARELSPEYLQNKGENAAPVHEPSSSFVAKMYEEELNKPDPKGNNIVSFTGGGTGAGKTTAIDDLPELKAVKDKSQIIYDTTLQGFNSADKKIAQALEKGKKVFLLYVHRDVVDAFENGVIPRANREGRAVPYKFHVETHVNAPETVARLAEKYKDNENVQIRVIDNTKGKGNQALADLDLLKNLKYNKDEVTQKLRDSIERSFNNGEISESTYKGLLGNDLQGASRLPRTTGSREPQTADNEATGKATDNLEVNDLRPEKQVRRVLNTKETQYLQDVIETKLNHARNVSGNEGEYVKNINELYKDITEKAGNDKVVLSSFRTQLQKEIDGIVGKTGNYKADYATFQEMLKQDDEIGRMLNVLDDKVHALDEKLLTAKEVMQSKPPTQKVPRGGGEGHNQEPVGTGKLAKSRAFERLKQQLEIDDPVLFNEIKDESVLYQKVNQRYDFENAAKLVEEDPKRAYRIAKGYEAEPPNQRQESIAIVLADRLREEGDITAWKGIEESMTRRQTRRGQEIYALRGRYDENSPHRFVQELLDRRLTNLGKSISTEAKDALVNLTKQAKEKGVSAKQAAIDIIDKEKGKLKQRLIKDRTRLKVAQDFLDSITC